MCGPVLRDSLYNRRRAAAGGERRPPPLEDPSTQTRLLTRLLQEVWFSAHACHAFLTSLFTSLFAGKREVTPVGAQSSACAGGTSAKCLQVKLGPFSSASLKQKFQPTWPLRAKGGRGWVISQPPSSANSSWPVHLGPNGAMLCLDSRAAWLLPALTPSAVTRLLFI